MPCLSRTPATLRPAPSNDVLRILAALSPENTPLPDFLCPYPTPAPPSSSARRRRAVRSASTLLSTTTASYYSDLNNVPPKYIKGEDGKWYTAGWSLHGRISPATSKSTTTASTGLSPTDLIHPSPKDDDDNTSGGTDADGDDDSTYTHDPALDVFSKYDDVLAALPTGWTPPPKRTKFYSAPIIIVFSLILAIVVTLVITGCVLSHKSKKTERKKAKKKAAEAAGADVEVEYADADDEVDMERDGESMNAEKEEILRMMKEQKKKERIWGRWRKQGQMRFGFGLRKRRRRNLSTLRGDDELLPDQEQRTLTPRVSMSSIATSTADTSTPSRSPIPPVPPLPPSATPSPVPPSQSLSTPSPVPLTPPPPSSPPPALPPAYRRRPKAGGSSQIYVDSDLSEDGAAQEEDAGEAESSLGGSGVPLIGHVATDDKATLERMRRAVSAPDVNEPEESVPVVPVWEDEQIEDFVREPQDVGGSSTAQQVQPQIRIQIDTSPALTTHSSSTSLLPPPPSAISLSPSSASLLSSHTYSPIASQSPSPRSPSPLTLPPPPSTHLDLVQRHLERGEEVVGPYYVPTFPEPGPIALPALGEPSAPETEDVGVVPSAPPLEGDMEYEEDMMGVASAPPLDMDADSDIEDRDEEQDSEEADQRYDGERQQVQQGSGSGSAIETPLMSTEWRPRGRERHDPLQGDVTVEGGDLTSERAKRISTASLPRYEP